MRSARHHFAADNDVVDVANSNLREPRGYILQNRNLQTPVQQDNVYEIERELC